MPQFVTRFVLPEVLYHGTTMKAIMNSDGFKKQIINNDFMRSKRSENRDFGTGFYTTIDFRQASEWARKSILTAWRLGVRNFAEEDLPAIVQIKYTPKNSHETINVLDFRGEADEWSDYILLHRLKSSLNQCDCNKVYGQSHPDIVCGPMADNDTGEVITNFKDNGYRIDFEDHCQWFREQITQTQDGYRRLGLELGDQIAWFGEKFNTFLRYDGYYKVNISCFLGDNVNEKNYREEWDFYVNGGKTQISFEV